MTEEEPKLTAVYLEVNVTQYHMITVTKGECVCLQKHRILTHGVSFLLCALFTVFPFSAWWLVSLDPLQRGGELSHIIVHHDEILFCSWSCADLMCHVNDFRAGIL